MAVPGYPNFFMLYGPNTNVGSNSVIFMLEAQAHYIVRALKYMRRKDKSYIEVRSEVMAGFLAKIDTWMQGTVWLTRCSNYFRAANGRVVTQWPRSARDFWGLTRFFRPGDYTFDAPGTGRPSGSAPRPPRRGSPMAIRECRRHATSSTASIRRYGTSSRPEPISHPGCSARSGIR